jgi:endonuclease/exonuclease/phosphatase family metal-dependent hydrolase
MDANSMQIEVGNFAPPRDTLWPPGSIRVVDWNINRGLRLSGILDFLAGANADLILLQEADLNARRTHRLNIAREVAQKLQMNYVFGREFEELTQGSRESPAYHGQATLSQWPLSKPRIIRFNKQSGFWRPRWFLPDIEPLQERLGGRMALVTEMNAGGRTVLSYNFHLESRGDDRLRCSQLDECLEDARRYGPSVPLVIGGDYNMDVTRTSALSVLTQARFRCVFSKPPDRTTPGSFLERGRPIDWIFTRGSVRSDGACVHTSVAASDHFPLSAKLVFSS